jgi:hypothetical protein
MKDGERRREGEKKKKRVIGQRRIYITTLFLSQRRFITYARENERKEE